MDETTLRGQLVALLSGRGAHVNFTTAVADFPADKINSRAANIPYSAWEVVEHMRLTQRDILDFIVDPEYREPSWPAEYWPDKNSPATVAAWQASLRQFQKDLNAVIKLVKDPKIDLTASLPYAPQANYLREFFLIADHNAYHTGQIVVLRRALGIYN